MKYSNGHYTIGLPRKVNSGMLSDNKSLALGQLRYLKNRLINDTTLFLGYCKVIRSGNAVKRTQEERNIKGSLGWFLPHHPVINPKKPDKISVVFDCATDYQGWWLNKCLLSGPNVFHDLVNALRRFKEGYIALAADIKETFLQVEVPKSDRGTLRFFWWTDGDMTATPDEYELGVHLFGATYSPFCVNFALQRTVEDFSNSILSEIVKENFYVDGCLVSVDSPNVAKRTVTELVDVLNHGGFQLTKWVSNKLSILSDIAESKIFPHLWNIDTESVIQRTLGIRWDFHADNLQITYLERDHPNTKRGLLSEQSSIFVSPVVLSGKLL